MIPTLKNYKEMIESQTFKEMDSYANRFYEKLGRVLNQPRNALHLWSRQWEYPFAFQQISDHLSTISGKTPTVLDAGSGDTFFPFYLATTYPHVRVVCCDYDPKLLRVYKNINAIWDSSVLFQVEDLRYLSFEADSFDVVYCISVLEHTENYERILDEFARILTPDGTFVITFDISLDGEFDIAVKEAKKLVERMENLFHSFHGTTNLDKLLAAEILTTKHVDRKLLPWRLTMDPYMQAIKQLKWTGTDFRNLATRAIKHFKGPIPGFKYLTVFGSRYRNPA